MIILLEKICVFHPIKIVPLLVRHSILTFDERLKKKKHIFANYSIHCIISVLPVKLFSSK